MTTDDDDRLTYEPVNGCERLEEHRSQSAAATAKKRKKKKKPRASVWRGEVGGVMAACATGAPVVFFTCRAA